jgi:hypothetical protein
MIDCNRKVAKKDLIQAAVLSLTSDEWLVVLEDGSAWVNARPAWLERWRHWVTAHYGTKF